jgi:predicted dehydrogenase
MGASPGGSARKIRYAVVGAGWISQQAFMPAVAHTGNSTMTALVTGDPEKARKLATRYGIHHVYEYGAYARMLKSDEVDAVYLAVPNSLHRAYAVPALEAGIHVLCEKPMAPSEADCRAMIAASEAANTKLMIAYRLHFEEATLTAIEMTRSRRIGEPRLFSSVFTQQVSARNRRTKAEFRAGPLEDMGPYCINAVRHLFGDEPQEVMAFSVSAPEPRFASISEAVSVLLRFPQERLAQFTVSFGANPVDEYRVVGTRGDLQVSPGYTFGVSLKHRLTIGQEVIEQSFPMVDQFGGELKYFSDCILNDRHPEPDGEEGLADVRVMAAAEEALRTGRPQRLDPMLRRRQPSLDQLMALEPVPAPDLIRAAPPDQG